MNRLTKRNADGKAQCVYKKTHTPGESARLCDIRDGCHWCGHKPNLLERLAAYEDTGYEPDEFKYSLIAEISEKSLKELNEYRETLNSRNRYIDELEKKLSEQKTDSDIDRLKQIEKEVISDFVNMLKERLASGQKPEVCKCGEEEKRYNRFFRFPYCPWCGGRLPEQALEKSGSLPCGRKSQCNEPEDSELCTQCRKSEDAESL